MRAQFYFTVILIVFAYKVAVMAKSHEVRSELQGI